MNVLGDMSALPSIMYDVERKQQSALAMPVKSTDNTPPTSAISFPANGSATTLVRNSLFVSGNATDFGGGQVAAVYISVDGSTWDLARGRGHWSYHVSFNTSSYLYQCRKQEQGSAAANNFTTGVTRVMAGMKASGLRIHIRSRAVDDSGWIEGSHDSIFVDIV